MMLMLDMDHPDFADQLMQVLGVRPGDAVAIVGPQFDRDDGVVPAIPDAWGILQNLPPETLGAIGCCAWDAPDEKGEQLWLFPAEWYTHIPDDFAVTAIDGKVEPFKHGGTSDDRRFGMLAYGVAINVRSKGENK